MSYAAEASGGRKLSAMQKAAGLGTLSMPRMKPRSLAISVAYRLTRLSRPVLGRIRLLRLCLNAAWLFRRFAYELGGEVFGNSFYGSATALSDKLLEQWIPRGASVVDVGCGTGRWSRIAARYARTVVGIDYNPANIAMARAVSNEPNIEYVLGDIAKGLDRQTFDVALLIHVLEHIDEADALLRMLHGMASTLIVEVPDFGADPLNLVRYELNCPYYYDADHVREYTMNSLCQQLEHNGWQIQDRKQDAGAIVVLAKSALPHGQTSRVS